MIKDRNFIDKREIHESTVKNPWITLYSRGGQNWFKTSKYADIQGRGHTTCSVEQKHAIQYKHCNIKTHSISCLSSYQALILPQESKCSIKNGLGMSLDMIKINIYFEHSKSLKAITAHRSSSCWESLSINHLNSMKISWASFEHCWSFPLCCPYILSKRTFPTLEVRWLQVLATKFPSWINVNLSAMQIIPSRQNIWTCPQYKHPYFRQYIQAPQPPPNFTFCRQTRVFNPLLLPHTKCNLVCCFNRETLRPVFLPNQFISRGQPWQWHLQNFHVCLNVSFNKYLPRFKKINK